MLNKYKIIVVLSFAFHVACSVEHKNKIIKKYDVPPINIMKIPDAIPKHELRTKAGNPVGYTIFNKYYKVLKNSKGYTQTGIASWYGDKFHGRKTSNGEIYDMYAMTAAHKTLPIPSYVRVTHLKNKRSIVVRINDRGPFHGNRIIDLSYVAAKKLGMQIAGTGLVEVSSIETDEPLKKSSASQEESALYLQIGAFNQLINAKKLYEKLLTNNILNSRIKSTQNSISYLHKVQIGPWHTMYQANDVHEKLALLGYTNVQLVTEKN